MKTSIVTLISIILLFSSCSKNNDEPKSYDNIITGLILRNNMGEAMGHIGSPNIKVSNVESQLVTNLRIVSYPNPCKENLNINITGEENNTPIKIAITKGIFNENATVEEIKYTSLSEITSDVIFEDIIANKNYYVDFSSFEDGYYRVYIEIEGTVYYDNIKKEDI
ncbi:MAG: hypothetical protein KAG37_05740 [Flavobacteriales bacterium]|nr:hypothetical protein [Flavobacteriales bacterium]